MDDYADLVHIQGMDVAAGELFQALAATDVAPLHAEEAGDPAADGWGELPDDVRQQTEQYFRDVSAWWEQAANDRSRGRSRGDLPAVRPAVPLVIAAASGGLTLPALGITLLTQIGLSLVDSVMGEVAKLVILDPLEDILEKALLEDDTSVLATLRDTYQAALLEDDGSGADPPNLQSILATLRDDLQALDAMLEIGDIKAGLRSRVVEYGG